MPLKQRPRALLADDHAGVLNALKRILEPTCDVIAQVMDGAAVLETTTRLSPDIVVLDISMPPIEGLDVCRQIRSVLPQVKVIVLTAAEDIEIKEKAFSAGAAGFVLKHLMAKDLKKAIDKALRGETYSSNVQQ